MKILKLIIDFYINTSIHVAFAIFCLVQITKTDLNASINFNIDLFIFLGTIFGYNFLKYFKVFQEKIFTIKKNYAILLVTFLSFLGLLFYFIKLEFETKLAFLEISIVVFSYPFMRKFGFLKMFIVALCVTYITVYIPALNFNSLEKTNYLWQRFFVVFCLLIPFEIIDVKKDAKTINTLPQIIGIQNLKFTGLILLFICICFLNLDYKIALSICFFIIFSTTNRSKYYTVFWVESLPVCWVLYYMFILNK